MKVFKIKSWRGAGRGESIWSQTKSSYDKTNPDSGKKHECFQETSLSLHSDPGKLPLDERNVTDLPPHPKRDWGARVQSAQLSPEPAHIRREARMHRPRLPRLSGSSAFSFPPKAGQLFAGSLAWQRDQTRSLTPRLPRRARRPTPLPFQKSGGQTGSQFSRPRPRTRGGTSVEPLRPRRAHFRFRSQGKKG